LGTGTLAGTLTFENNASLVQLNDAAINSGNIIYRRSLELKQRLCTGLLRRGQELAKFSSTIKYLWSASGNNWSCLLPLMQIAKGI
jgi:hypothetical protein